MADESLQTQDDAALKLDAAPPETTPPAEPAVDLAPEVDKADETAAEDIAPVTVLEQPASEPAVDLTAPIGPRWYAVHTRSQPAPVNLLLRDATADHEANIAAVIERFKFGHGITHTPHELRVRDLGADYVPTGADVDHHEAIEAAIASAASAK